MYSCSLPNPIRRLSVCAKSFACSLARYCFWAGRLNNGLPHDFPASAADVLLVHQFLFLLELLVAQLLHGFSLLLLQNTRLRRRPTLFVLVRHWNDDVVVVAPVRNLEEGAQY